MKKRFRLLLAIIILALFAGGAHAGTTVYNDFGIRQSGGSISSVIDITVTGQAGDVAAGATLSNHPIRHMDRIIGAQLQLVQVDLIPGVTTEEPAEVDVWITDGQTIIWGPETIDNSTDATAPGSIYGGHIKGGVFPVVDTQLYLNVAVIGTGKTVRVKLKFK